MSRKPATPRSRPSTRFSATVNTSTSMKCWCTMPIPASIASPGLRLTCGTPSMVIMPSSGCSSPYRTFIRVDLPAPFSPSRQWISPGTMSRSMASLATSDPNRLVIPRRQRPVPASAAGDVPRAISVPKLSLRLGLGLDLDLAADDVRLQGVELGLELGGHLAVELVERRETGALVLQRADVRLLREAAVLGCRDGVLHRDVQTLVDAGDDVRAVLLRADAAVGVHPDGVDLAAAGLGRLQRALTGRAGHREQDVGTLADQALGRLLPALDVLEGLLTRDELAVLLVRVPAEDLDVFALLLVVVLHALAEAVHEDRHGGNLQPAEGADLLGLRHPRRQVTPEEAGLRGVEHQRLQVLRRRVGLRVVVVHDGELDV